jgi:hypothetical protein
MYARLAITASGYVLSRLADGAWRELAALPGGDAALLRGNGLPDDAALEMAIELAEDWVMPHATGLAGAQLEVVDGTGRVAAGMQDVFASRERQWDVAQLESLFNEIAFKSARPHTAASLSPHRAFVADLVLLRELAHHAKLRWVRLAD